MAALVEFGAAEDAAAAAALLSRDQLQHQYEVAILDMCRSVQGRWGRGWAKIRLKWINIIKMQSKFKRIRHC